MIISTDGQFTMQVLHSVDGYYNICLLGRELSSIVVSKLKTAVIICYIHTD